MLFILICVFSCPFAAISLLPLLFSPSIVTIVYNKDALIFIRRFYYFHSYESGRPALVKVTATTARDTRYIGRDHHFLIVSILEVYSQSDHRQWIFYILPRHLIREGI